MSKGNMKSLIQRKVDSYNKAEDGARTGQAREYRMELNGMQQLLETMGIWLELKYDKEFHLEYTLEVI